MMDDFTFKNMSLTIASMQLDISTQLLQIAKANYQVNADTLVATRHRIELEDRLLQEIQSIMEKKNEL